jgi:kumamolisin
MKKMTKSHVGWFALMAALTAGCNSNGGDSSTTDNSGSSCTPVTTTAPAAPNAKIQFNTNNEVYLDAASPDFAASNASGGDALKKLHGHIPSKVKDFSDQGKVADEQIMPITVALELNNESDLETKLNQMYQVGSATYHQFLTPAQFRSQYAPTAQQLAQVSSLLQAQGMTGVTVSDNKLYVKASGPVSAINSIFHTEIHQYQDAQSKQYFAPAYELQVPMESGIKAVVGLQNVTQARKHSVRANDQSHSTGSGPSGGLSPSDVRTAYNIPTSVTGAGQTLALFELDGYTASDIAAYESEFSLPSVPLQNVLVDGATGAAGGGADEVTLDIELMTAIAPGVSKILVYEGPNSEASILDVYAKIASDNLAQSVSSSWGSSEDSMSASSIQAEDTVFKQMAAQGQSFYSAAGDSGSDDNGSSLSVDDPSSQPYVVGVGGTSLTVGSGGAYQSETTWNDGTSGGAGGGGVSTVWTIPAWQTGAATGNTLGSTTMRNVPDVSLEADPNNGYSIYIGGSWAVFGGTSCAAPLWAAYTALLNQKRVANGQSLIGFPNALLYQTGKGSRYGTDFHDIADGSNNGYYPAVTGYDDATGWGSFNGTNLFDDLSDDTAISVNNPINSCGT